MAEFENTIESFKTFLSTFSSRDAPTEDSPLPFRLQSYSVTKDEIEGEVLDWCILLLDQLHCPDFLKFTITREVVKSVVSGGLEQYEQEKKVESEDDTVYYKATMVAKTTFMCLHNICIKWNEHLPDFSLSHLNSYCVCGIKNTRRKMEDKHTVIPDLNTLLGTKDQPHTQYYAVFDGHGGLDASSYASRQFHLKLARQKSFATDVECALKKSILELDEQYCKKSTRESLRSGTTAVVAVIRENVLNLAWIGDSQAVLVREGKPVTLMIPHKPDREDEKQRIEALGGCVIWFGAWRVNGTLSVSRAIGDADYKPFVSGDADTSRTEFTGSEDYLCLACDGFWDVFDGKQLVTLVTEHLRECGDKKSLARHLCVKAKEAGSSDNITVLIVFLRDEITLVDSQNRDEETITNDANDGNSEMKNSDVKENNNSNNSSNNTSLEEIPKDSITQEGNVMVQGSKLQPAVKNIPPHRIFINKPQNINSKVSVIVTESSPHAKLPCSVITHKSPWQSPQISPVLRRRDTRESLISTSANENDETTTMLNLWARDSQPNAMQYNANGFLPALVPDNKHFSHSNHTSPAPSCVSEPSMSGNRLSGNRHIHYPTRPNAHRQSRGRLPYKASIVNTLPSEEVAKPNMKLHRRRRVSHSLPMQFSYVGEMNASTRRSQSIFRENTFWKKYGTNFARRLTIAEGVSDTQKENYMLTDSTPDIYELETDIAITNSLFNKLKPKKTNKENKVVTNGKHHPPVPIKALYRRQRSKSAL